MLPEPVGTCLQAAVKKNTSAYVLGVALPWSLGPVSLEPAEEMCLAAPCSSMKENGVAVLRSPDVFKSTSAGVERMSVDFRHVLKFFPCISDNGLCERVWNSGERVRLHAVSFGTMPT